MAGHEGTRCVAAALCDRCFMDQSAWCGLESSHWEGSMPRLSFHVSLAAVALFTLVSSGHEPALRLRIQALTLNTSRVRVSMTAAGTLRAPKWSDTVVATPTVLPIADSVQSVHIVVRGFGSVRATLTDSEDPGKDLLIAEGRDLTLSRDPRGRFHRAWTAQPLVP